MPSFPLGKQLAAQSLGRLLVSDFLFKKLRSRIAFSIPTSSCSADLPILGWIHLLNSVCSSKWGRGPRYVSLCISQQVTLRVSPMLLVMICQLRVFLHEMSAQICLSISLLGCLVWMCFENSWYNLDISPLSDRDLDVFSFGLWYCILEPLNMGKKTDLVKGAVSRPVSCSLPCPSSADRTVHTCSWQMHLPEHHHQELTYLTSTEHSTQKQESPVKLKSHSTEHIQTSSGLSRYLIYFKMFNFSIGCSLN